MSNQLNTIEILRADEWEMVFLNGVLVNQNHAIQVWELEPYVPIGKLSETYVSDDFSEAIFSIGSLPENITLADALAMKWK